MPFGFFDYYKAGKGVAKNEPEKRPFFKFFELFGRKFWKLIHVNLLYILFCLPIITIGPATVALTQVMRKYVLEQPIFLFDEFWTAFKKNFKQGFIVGIFDIFFVVAFVFAVVYYDFWATYEPSFGNTVLMSMTIAAGVMIIMMHFYIYPQIAALNLKLTQIVRNSLLLVILGIKRNIVTLFVGAALVIGMIYLNLIALLLLPFVPSAWICFLSVFNSYPTIQKYIITPFYEARGEKNPEIPDFKQETEEALFEDFGGREPEIKSKPKPKGKVIR